MPETTLYTIQMAKWRKLKDSDIFFLDVTVKSGLKGFAPEWDWVMGHKGGMVSDEAYTEAYNEKMKASMIANPKLWGSLLKYPKIAVACYCSAGKFCHRHLLLPHMTTYLAEHNHTVILGGEIS